MECVYDINLPDWAKYKATDGNGETWVYEKKPTIPGNKSYYHTWVTPFGSKSAFVSLVNPALIDSFDWKKTLRRIRK